MHNRASSNIFGNEVAPTYHNRMGGGISVGEKVMMPGESRPKPKLLGGATQKSNQSAS